ncbi:Ovomucoid [Orchesella cincta]|uniref:Ovomucoid n=1 Tax=Orchesella cincta TaxID=48709 RepID=A0A1D2N1F8_ORCCI|nr:Ovomucoid [Orchesella cincta]
MRLIFGIALVLGLVLLLTETSAQFRPIEQNPFRGIIGGGGRRISCACPYNYQPVCGNNAKTYGNSCELNCQRRHNSSRVRPPRKSEKVSMTFASVEAQHFAGIIPQLYCFMKISEVEEVEVSANQSPFPDLRAYELLPLLGLNAQLIDALHLTNEVFT